MQILNPLSCRKILGVSDIKLCFAEERPLLAQGSFSSPAVFPRYFPRASWGVPPMPSPSVCWAPRPPGYSQNQAQAPRPCDTHSHLSFLTSPRRQGKLHPSHLRDEELRQEDGKNVTELLMIQDYFRKETKKLSLNIRLGPGPSLPIATLPHHTLCFPTLSSSPLGTSPHGPLNQPTLPPTPLWPRRPFPAISSLCNDGCSKASLQTLSSLRPSSSPWHLAPGAACVWKYPSRQAPHPISRHCLWRGSDRSGVQIPDLLTTLLGGEKMRSPSQLWCSPGYSMYISCSEM